MRAVLVTLAAVASLGMATSANAEAVILNFATNEFACTGVDGGNVDRACTTNGQFIGGDYGSTAVLDVSYDRSESSGSAISLLFSTGNGGRAYEFPSGDEPSLVIFTPLSGYEVSFSNFTWSKTSATSSSNFLFEVVDENGGLLFTAGNSQATYAVNTAYFAGPLTFRFSNGGRGSVAIDRIAVDVKAVDAPPPPPPPMPAIPEPATWAMMILGFGAAGSMIRRRRAAIA